MINVSCLCGIEQTRCNISHNTTNHQLLGSNSFCVTNCYFHNIDPADFFPICVTKFQSYLFKRVLNEYDYFISISTLHIHSHILRSLFYSKCEV